MFWKINRLLTIIIFIKINLNFFIQYVHGDSDKSFDQNIRSHLIGSYDYTYEYSPDLYKIYEKYLINKNNKCLGVPKFASDLTEIDFNVALEEGDQKLKQQIADDKRYLEEDPRGLNFSKYLYNANLRAKYNEFVTKSLVEKKCLDRIDTEINLPSIQPPEGLWKNNKFCDLESSVSPLVKCDPKYKYRREDGKCTNLEKTNWGSSFHCQRRLLPPDYADGVNQPRIAADGSPLPNPRLISNTLMPDIEFYDNEWTSLKMIWGQFVAHDAFKTLQYFGGGIRCCPNNQSPQKSVHWECYPIENIPSDRLSLAYNQTCINFIRQISCRTCSLGHREQINAATPLLDLSNFYGGNENNSQSLRAFTEGLMRFDKSLEGDDVLPKAILPEDQDRIDLNTCQLPADRPWLSCFLGGDGIRTSQQPLIATVQIMFVRRHNQHAMALAKVNPHWNDEILYQEAKRIMIAEYNYINFNEYFPATLNKQYMQYYGLNVEQNGFTHFNSNVDPNGIQAVGVAAFRFGHTTVSSRFQIIRKIPEQDNAFKLRFKFQEMSDLWDGSANGIIKGLSAHRRRQIDPFIVTDVHDYLFFRPNNPVINDLPAVNINRGRDRGIPGYIYFLEFCTGIQINSWDHLKQFIPENYIKRMANVYHDVRDIDLFVGALAERHLNGSTLGPTFGCLLGIQFHHWKYGDRFYFEHGQQSGSFTLEQLNNIRKTASLANMVCKTTDFGKIQSQPFRPVSNSNRLVSCLDFPEFDYSLWSHI